MIPEILSEIFVQCLQPSDRLWDLTVTPSLTPKTTPLYLGQICSSWRMVALSTPELWATFIMDDDDYYGNRILRRGAKDEWFCRSAGYPLSLGIFWIHGGWTDWINQVDSIPPLSHRLDTAIFDTKLSHIKKFAAIRSHLSQLRHLGLRLQNDHQPPIAPMLDIFEEAPRLQSLAISAAWQGWYENLTNIRITALKLPWSQSTCLQLRGSSRRYFGNSSKMRQPFTLCVSRC